MMKWKKGFLTLAAALVLPLGACDSGTDLGEPGKLTLLLTDAPGDFQKAVVTISRVEMVGSGGESDVLVLRDTPVTTDLLTLANDVETLVQDATVPAGTYSQIRFVIPGACIVVEQEDGSGKVFASSGYTECGAADGALQLPSFAQSGIKVNLPGGSITVSGEQKVLLLDFDVSESFGQQAGMSGQWVMTPVINATDFGLTSSIAFTVVVPTSVDLAALGVAITDFQAQLNDEPAIALGSDSTVTFLYLDAANSPFSVSLVAPENVTITTDLELPLSVPVTSGTEAEASVTVTSAVATGG